MSRYPAEKNQPERFLKKKKRKQNESPPIRRGGGL